MTTFDQKVMTSFDQQFWDEHGYVVIPNVVPQANLQAVIDAIWAYTGKDSHNSASWYQEPLLEGAMVNMSNSQPMWDNRQAPRLHEIFTELWGTEKLWVVLDRVNLNPPVNEQWHHQGFLHWDMDPTKPPEPLFQGVLYLTDTSEAMGGFQCVPGSHRRLLEWQATHTADEGTPPPGTSGRDWMMQKQHPIKEWVMEGLKAKSIPGKAGDFLIWNVALLHGNGKNVSDQPRLAQYISMSPEGTARHRSLVYGGEPLLQARINSWRCGPYPQVVADALGVPEGVANPWLRSIIDNPDNVQTLPQARCTPRLTEAQLRQLPTLLAARKPWTDADIVDAKLTGPQYGISGSFLAVELLSKQVAELMREKFGLTFTAEPAHLTDLGKKLLGLERW
ncbi:hypothetical protein BH10CHL1_BH10CHL1_25710 [soil metagenome]